MQERWTENWKLPSGGDHVFIVGNGEPLKIFMKKK